MLKQLTSLIVIFCFFINTVCPLVQAHADVVLNLPVPGAMVSVSPNFEPALIKGITVHQDNPFLFDFIVDPGQSKLSGDALKQESDRMIKYFFASLTLPDKDIWVNLSPYERDRMVPESLGETFMGRDLLAQDYMLKQLTASLIYPQAALGKTFWDRVYAQAKEKFGTTQIPVNTFNKVWIMPQSAGIYEHGQTAFIVEGHLKVMLEEDYLSLKKHNAINSVIARGPQGDEAISERTTNDTHAIGSQVIRQIILPEIEREVNDGKNFATLRQIFYAQVLAVWFKRNLKQALLNRVYANKGTVKGIDDNNTAINEAIYHRYLSAYKKGVFNYIGEDIDPVTQEALPRKYFSGGYFGNSAMLSLTNYTSLIQLPVAAYRSMAGVSNDSDYLVSIQGSKAAATSLGLLLRSAAFVQPKASHSSAAMVTLTSVQQEAVVDFSKKHQSEIRDLSSGNVARIVFSFEDLGASRPALAPFIELIDPLLRKKKFNVKSGSVQFFNDLKSTYGIDVPAINDGKSIIVRADFFISLDESSRVIVQQAAMMLGFSNAAANVLERMSLGSNIDTNGIKALQDELETIIKNNQRSVRSNNIPPLTIVTTLALVLVTANMNIDSETKFQIIKALHYIATFGLAAHLVTGFNQMIEGETGVAYLDGKETTASNATINAALGLAVTGGILAPLYTMHDHPWISSGGILGAGALFLWAWKKRSLKKFLENKDLTIDGVLESTYQNYQKFWEISANYPAAAAIASFITGTYLNQGGANGEWWLKAAFLFFGQMIVEGLSRYNPKASEVAVESSKSFFDGQVTEGLRKAIGNDRLNNFLLYMKPAWWIAFFDWMVLRPDSSAFLDKLYQPTWGHFSYVPYTVVGALFGVSTFLMKKGAEWWAKQGRLRALQSSAAMIILNNFENRYTDRFLSALEILRTNDAYARLKSIATEYDSLISRSDVTDTEVRFYIQRSLATINAPLRGPDRLGVRDMHVVVPIYFYLTDLKKELLKNAAMKTAVANSDLNFEFKHGDFKVADADWDFGRSGVEIQYADITQEDRQDHQKLQDLLSGEFHEILWKGGRVIFVDDRGKGPGGRRHTALIFLNNGQLFPRGSVYRIIQLNQSSVDDQNSHEMSPVNLAYYYSRILYGITGYGSALHISAYHLSMLDNVSLSQEGGKLLLVAGTSNAMTANEKIGLLSDPKNYETLDDYFTLKHLLDQVLTPDVKSERIDQWLKANGLLLFRSAGRKFSLRPIAASAEGERSGQSPAMTNETPHEVDFLHGQERKFSLIDGEDQFMFVFDTHRSTLKVTLNRELMANIQDSTTVGVNYWLAKGDHGFFNDELGVDDKDNWEFFIGATGSELTLKYLGSKPRTIESNRAPDKAMMLNKKLAIFGGSAALALLAATWGVVSVGSGKKSSVVFSSPIEGVRDPKDGSYMVAENLRNDDMTHVTDVTIKYPVSQAKVKIMVGFIYNLGRFDGPLKYDIRTVPPNGVVTIPEEGSQSIVGLQIVSLHASNNQELVSPDQIIIDGAKPKTEVEIKEDNAPSSTSVARGRGVDHDSAMGGIDLSQTDSAMHVSRDANGGVRIDVDPSLVAEVERDGISVVIPVIVAERPADPRLLFGVDWR